MKIEIQFTRRELEHFAVGLEYMSAHAPVQSEFPYTKTLEILMALRTYLSMTDPINRADG